LVPERLDYPDRLPAPGGHRIGPTPNAVVARAKSRDVQIVDLRFCDLPGLTQ
jgi:hypothetical protein